MRSKQQDRRHRDEAASSRRSFLSSAGAGAGALALAACAGQSRAAPGPAKPEAGREEGEEGEGEVSASEDLMREHGALDRLLLVYEESRRRLGDGGDYRADVLHKAADLVRRFIEQYHEKLEEDYLFPRFEKAGQLVELVHVLAQQHVAGRRATEIVLAQTASAKPDRAALTGAIDAFVRMYRPHSAREDTVLFPALHRIVSPAELAELGEQFEEVEHQRFGAGGFEAVVGEIAELERTLGINSLAQFTPKL